VAPHDAVPSDLLDRLCANDRRTPCRTALVLAHPDDETVGAAALLLRGRDTSVVHVTDGAPRDLRDARAAGLATREEYARVRREERAAALSVAGLPAERVHDLGIVDQEASLSLASLARRMAELLSALGPEVIITHPYEGGHPDHDATAFAVHSACALLRDAGAVPPAIVEQTSYHDRNGAMAVFEFLPSEWSEDVRTLELTAEERALKQRMLDQYRTQRGVLQYFPVAVERLRVAPRYDFTRPPHPGTLWYERFDWGVTGARWRQLAALALGELALEPVA
jgi:LmbE family N-acetylglucosaminyl deacetylase